VAKKGGNLEAVGIDTIQTERVEPIRVSYRGLKARSHISTYRV
jgi:hypothetical protein